MSAVATRPRISMRPSTFIKPSILLCAPLSRESRGSGVTSTKSKRVKLPPKRWDLPPGSTGEAELRSAWKKPLFHLASAHALEYSLDDGYRLVERTVGLDRLRRLWRG